MIADAGDKGEMGGIAGGAISRRGEKCGLSGAFITSLIWV